MKQSAKKNYWEKKFNLIKDNAEFIEYYCEVEDKWLQYSGWENKIKGIFGSYKKAITSFQKFRSKSRISLVNKKE